MNAPAWKGRFIVFEGIDGAGTTSQSQLLAQELRREGFRVLGTSEPSDGPIGSLIRQALTRRLGLPASAGPLTDDTLALLFAADRVDHLQAQIIPALHRGDVVICDRYLLSSLAYQGSTLPMDWVEQINSQAVAPDLTLFVEVDLDTAAQRRLKRGGAAELYENAERQRQVVERYASAIVLRRDKDRIVRVDGTRPLEEVSANVCSLAKAELRRAGMASSR